MNLEQLVNKFISDVKAIGTQGGDPVIVDDPFATVEYDAYTGWAINTPTGAPRSRRVDELRQELYDKGYKVIADQIPVYHCIAYWLDQPFPETAFININKVKAALANFGTFASVVEDQNEENLVDNIVWQTKSLLPAIINTNRNYPKVEYRGQEDRQGFVRVVWDGSLAMADFSPASPPNYRDLVANDAIKRPAAQSFCQHRRTFDMFGHNSAPLTGTDRPDHYVYNIWWKGKTDEDVGRFWRNWAVAVGANVPVEA